MVYPHERDDFVHYRLVTFCQREFQKVLKAGSGSMKMVLRAVTGPMDHPEISEEILHIEVHITKVVRVKPEEGTFFITCTIDGTALRGALLRPRDRSLATGSGVYCLVKSAA